MMLAASPKRHLRRNKQVLLALGVWFGFAIAVFTWSGVQNIHYRAQYSVYETEVKTLVDTIPARIVATSANDDARAVAAVLSEIAATTSQKIAQAPNLPTVLGLHLGLTAETKRHSSVTEAGNAAAASLKNAADFILFQHNIARAMQELSLKDVSGYDQTVALANAWKEAADTVQHAEKSPRTAEISAMLSQKMLVVESRIRELADLYKQNDSAGFAAKQNELAGIINEFKPLSESFAEIASSLEDDLQLALNALRQKLQ